MSEYGIQEHGEYKLRDKRYIDRDELAVQIVWKDGLFMKSVGYSR